MGPGRFRSTWAQWERVLALAERALADWVGEPLAPDAFERHRAFRWDASRPPGRLGVVEAPDSFDLDDLAGVERSVARLVANTEQFLAGFPSNNVLLYGDRGTGKSSAVKGLLTRYGDRGLRLVEVHKDDLLHLPRILASLRGAPQRFLLFSDDLSFAAGERGHQELKACLEGSLVAPPGNVRIVVTSNRRHLVSESRSDAAGAHLDEAGELRLGETVEEKLALADRFGLVLPFIGFDQATYLRIVDRYARQAGLATDPEELRAEALRWALDRSSRSGRTARQFVDDAAGREALARQRAGTDARGA
jgi:predicted AAA+ superfamily ATPase